MSAAEKAYEGRNLNKLRNDVYTNERTGVELPWFIPSSSLDAMQIFEVRPSDVFFLTYSKSGTTWMRHITKLIMEGANEEALGSSSSSHYSMPDLYPEFHVFQDDDPPYKMLARMSDPRFIFTHLSPALQPQQIFQKNPKVVYVARNPKDVAVSLYYHYLQDGGLKTYTWNEFFKLFLKGQVGFYGEWGDHVVPWWKKRNEKNVFFVKYEDIVRDHGKVVKQLASFLEQDHLTDEQLNKITQLTTLESMTKMPTAKMTAVCEMWNIEPSKSPFVRKGKVGGWKDYFTVAQNEEFDEVYKRWIGDSGLQMDFTLP